MFNKVIEFNGFKPLPGINPVIFEPADKWVHPIDEETPNVFVNVTADVGSFSQTICSNGVELIIGVG